MSRARIASSSKGPKPGQLRMTSSRHHCLDGLITTANRFSGKHRASSATEHEAAWQRCQMKGDRVPGRAPFLYWLWLSS